MVDHVPSKTDLVCLRKCPALKVQRAATSALLETKM